MLLLSKSSGVKAAVPLLMAVVAILLWLFWGLGGPDFLIKRYGPVSVWFSRWEGEATVPDPKKDFEIRMHPTGEKPAVLVIQVSGAYEGKSRFRIPSLSDEISIPASMDRLWVFDWYNGDVDVQYESDKLADDDIKIKWVFGY